MADKNNNLLADLPPRKNRRCGRPSLEETNPEKVQEIVTLAAEGYSMNQISKKLGIHFSTVSRIWSRYHEAIEIYEQQALMGAKIAAQETYAAYLLKMQQVQEDPNILGKTNARDLAVAHGIFSDRISTIAGKPTSIQETRQGISIAQAKAAIEEARRKVREESMDAEENGDKPGKDVGKPDA